MSRILALITILLACAVPARAEQLITSLSTHRVLITSNFTGAELILFGSIERDAETVSRPGGYDLVVTVLGPRQTIVTRRKDRILGIWANTDSLTFPDAPAYLAVRTNRPVEEIADAATLQRLQVGLANIALPSAPGEDAASNARSDAFRSAFLRLKVQQGHYRERANAVTFLTPTLFRATIPLPADVPIGTYEIDLKLFAAGAMVTRESNAFEIVKVGFEQFVAHVAQTHGFFYGLATAAMAMLTGWLASVAFRRD